MGSKVSRWKLDTLTHVLQEYEPVLIRSSSPETQDPDYIHVRLKADEGVISHVDGDMLLEKKKSMLFSLYMYQLD
jgi:hypothetical protein